MAEYVVVSDQQLHRLPDNVDSLQGAWVEPLAVALRAVRRSGVRLGDSVCIIGGGPIGQLAVQLVRRAGATSVTLVEPSPKRRAMAVVLGADHVYEPDEHAAGIAAGDARHVDRVIECSGHPLAVQAGINMLRPGGSIQLVAISPRPLTFDAMSAIAKEIRIDANFIYVDEFASAIDLLARAAIDIASLTSAVMTIDNFNNAFDALRQPEETIKALIRIP